MAPRSCPNWRATPPGAPGRAAACCTTHPAPPARNQAHAAARPGVQKPLAAWAPSWAPGRSGRRPGQPERVPGSPRLGPWRPAHLGRSLRERPGARGAAAPVQAPASASAAPSAASATVTKPLAAAKGVVPRAPLQPLPRPGVLECLPIPGQHPLAPDARPRPRAAARPAAGSRQVGSAPPRAHGRSTRRSRWPRTASRASRRGSLPHIPFAWALGCVRRQ